MIKILRKIIDIIFWIAAVLLLILLFLLGGVRLFGYTPYVITSGSMIPVYPVGSVVYVNGVNPEELEAGDDISFYMTEDVVATHRIGGVDKAGKCVTTYGVNNLDSEGNQINDAKAVDFDYNRAGGILNSDRRICVYVDKDDVGKGRCDHYSP